METTTVPYKVCYVFSMESRPFSGNSLAVCILNYTLPQGTLQNIAKLFNLSETAFVFPKLRENGHYTTRIFTAETELPFAGHPSIGAAHTLRTLLEDNQGQSPDTFELDLKGGPVTVDYNAAKRLYWLHQPPAQFLGTVNGQDLFHVFKVETDSILKQKNYDIVSTGLPYVIVPLSSTQELSSVSAPPSSVIDFSTKHGIFGVLFFAPGAQVDFEVRVFVAEMAIPEDPATGSANGCLGAWLLNKSGQDGLHCVVHQGGRLGKPSQIHIKGHRKGRHILISCGGRVTNVMTGHITVPVEMCPIPG